MTDGTSQGLFIVVAIVIFGIFVALSYTVFGSDGLTGGITGLFENATQGVETKITGFRTMHEFSMLDVRPHYGSYEVFLNESNQIVFRNDSTFRGGVRFPATLFELGETYTISFDMTKLSGEIRGIGGHLQVSDNVDVYIDGIQEQEIWRNRYSDSDVHDWSRGVVYPNDMEKHKVELTFTVTISDISDESIYIQPNRNHRGFSTDDLDNGIDFEVMIENLILKHHVE